MTYNILFEDEELENLILSGDSPIAVPLSIFIDNNNNITITIYKFVESCLLDILKNFSSDHLKGEDLYLFLDCMKKPLLKYNYEFGDSSIQDILEYVFEPETELNFRKVENLFIIQDRLELEDVTYKTASELNCEKDNIFDVGAVIIKDGSVVSIAETNDISDEEGIEIYVETAEEYRGYGYAKLLVYELSKYISSLGENVLYKCSSDNTASKIVAENSGMKCIGRRISFVAFKI